MLRLRSHSFSFFSYGLKAKARAKDFLHIAFHLLYSEFEIQTQRLLVAILLFICCTRNLKLDQQHLLVAIMLFICCTQNFDCAAGNGKHIKTSNGLLTCCISTEYRPYIISVDPSPNFLFKHTELHSLM